MLQGLLSRSSKGPRPAPPRLSPLMWQGLGATVWHISQLSLPSATRPCTVLRQLPWDLTAANTGHMGDSEAQMLTLQSPRSGHGLKQALRAVAPCRRDALPAPQHSTHRMLRSGLGQRASSKERLGGAKPHERNGMKRGYPKEQPGVKTKAKSTQKSLFIALAEF